MGRGRTFITCHHPGHSIPVQMASVSCTSGGCLLQDRHHHAPRLMAVGCCAEENGVLNVPRVAEEAGL